MGARMVYGVGATKAGTSWLWTALSRHPGTAFRTVKELHYWDTLDPSAAAWQAGAFRRQVEAARSGAARARAAGDEARALRREAEAAELEGLIAVIEGDRAADRGYRDFVAGGAGDRLAGDVTPAYALQPVEILRRMLDALPGARVIYLIRDPVSRLWSHVRMHASRRPSGTDFEARANGILRRMLDEGAEEHIDRRGDYPAAVARLRAAVPEDRLRIDFAERAWTAEGWASIQAFLGLPPVAADTGHRVHEGQAARLGDGLRRRATLRLLSHYDWAAREVGPLPAEWQASLERAHA